MAHPVSWSTSGADTRPGYRLTAVDDRPRTSADRAPGCALIRQRTIPAVIDPAIPQHLGKYLIRGQIGRGGMGVVYRAFDPTLEREVAIKIIRTAKLDFADQITRFAAEAKALAQLCSPNVVQVYDYHPDPIEPYLVMEYVRGRSLSAVLREEGSLPLRRLVDCAWQVLSGLTVAHGAGILHRDLKPGNLLLAVDGVYKLADFGLATGTGPAQLDQEDLTGTGEIVGTVRYLAPERAAGGDATVATDLYALGVTLYELATGKHPVPKEDNPLRIAQRITKEPLPPLSTMLPDLPPLFAAWFDRLIAHDPLQRFPTAAAALQALEPIEVPAGPDQRRATTRRTQKHEDSGQTVPMTLSPSVATYQVSGTGSTGRAKIAGTNRPPSTAIAMPVSGLRPVPAALMRKPRIRFVIKLILAIWVFSSAATVIAGLAISHRAISDQEVHLRANLASAAAGAALMVDGDVHRRLATAGATANRDAAFPDVVAALRRFKQTHPEVTYIYTMAKLPDSDRTKVVAFVVDASEATDRNHNGVIDPDEVIAEPGKTYSAADVPRLLDGFERPSADDRIVRDQWGSWLSGYAPIRDAQGRSTGLVGVDLAAGHVARLKYDFMAHSGVLLVSTLIAFLAGGVLVALRMRRPIVDLQKGLLKVAQGDLDTKVDVRSADEFRILADTFNFMIGELRDAAAIRRAFEGFVAHSLATQLNRPGAVPSLRGGLAARLYCDLDQGDGPLVDRAALGRVLSQVLPMLFDAARAHGGVPERVQGTGVLIVFPTVSAEDRPQAQAVRAALAFLAAVENSGTLARVAIGIDLGEDPSGVERRAVALGHLNRQLGTDLLVSSDAFLPIRSSFYADRLHIEPLGQDLPAEGYAVKGAVSV